MLHMDVSVLVGCRSVHCDDEYRSGYPILVPKGVLDSYPGDVPLPNHCDRVTSEQMNTRRGQIR